MLRLVVLTTTVLGLATSARADRAAEPPLPREHKSMPDPPAAPAVKVVAPLRPAPEVAALGKQLAGTWTCKGVSMKGDGSSTPVVATVVIALTLDDSWITTSLVETRGIDPLKWIQYTTFDATAKQWTRVQLANNSGHVVATSLGEKSGLWTWTGTATSTAGTLQLRDFEQRDGKQLKLWGDALLGGTWQKAYEVVCKR